MPGWRRCSSSATPSTKPASGIQEKISLLTHGIADLTDIVALQITIEGGKLPLVVSQDRYAGELKAAGADPLKVLRTPPETAVALLKSGGERSVSVDYVPETGKWLATVIMPLRSPLAGARAAFSAKIDLGRIAAAIAANPFQQTGSISLLDADGRLVLDKSRADWSDRDYVKQALARLSSNTPVITVDSYLRPDGTATLGASSFSLMPRWAVLVEKSEANAYFAVGEMIESLVVWIAVGLFAAALGALVFALRISRPILKIGEAATRVGEGNFQARVEGVRSRDEIGDLATRINTMIGQINERFQLAKFVSGGTMAAIQKSDAGGVKLGGERREVAILFADIRGYTAFAEVARPEDRRRRPQLLLPAPGRRGRGPQWRHRQIRRRPDHGGLPRAGNGRRTRSPAPSTSRTSWTSSAASIPNGVCGSASASTWARSSWARWGAASAWTSPSSATT